MANQQINALQVTTQKSWTDLTTENHLSAAFAEHPQIISDVISRVFGLNQYRGLEYMLSKVGTTTLESDREYEWYLKGDDREAVNIVEYSAADSTRPGVNRTQFKLTLAKKYFVKTDKIIFDNRDYSVVILDEGYSDGTNWTYTVMHMVPDDNHYIPSALLQAGKQVSKVYSPQEQTLGRSFGGTSFTSPFKMRNYFSTIAKKYVVPANMHDRQVVITMTDPASGQKTKVWTKYAEWVMLEQWVREKENNLMYSEFNQNQNGTVDFKGDSGYPIFEGAGLRQQIAPAHKYNYNKFNIDYLTEVLLSLSINILPEDSRHFVAMTGERGMVQFHKALEAKAALFQPLNTNRVQGSGQNLRFEGQYVEYRGPQGIRFTLVNLPQYNDVIDNRNPHPDGGFTENYRYTILNFGTNEGTPNIQKVFPKNGNKMWHVAGSASPFGMKKSLNEGSGSAVDGYELYMRTTQGIMIKNPMSCAELIYASSI